MDSNRIACPRCTAPTTITFSNRGKLRIHTHKRPDGQACRRADPDTLVKTCGCGREYTPEKWNGLPDPKRYTLDFAEGDPTFVPEPGEATVSTQEQRQCACGSHIVVEIERDGVPTRVSKMLAALLAAAAMILVLIGCGGAQFTAADRKEAPDAETADSGGAETDTPDAGGDQEATTQPDAGHDAQPAHDSGNTQDSGTRPDAKPDAPPPPTCMCGGGRACEYAIDEPPVGAGSPQPVTTVVMTPSHLTENVVANITTPPTPDHNAIWYDIDVSAFPAGGTITISGIIGAMGTDGSAFLVAQCYDFPASGSFTPVSPAMNVGNVPAGSPWNFAPYMFSAGTTVLHLGTEGSWYNASVCPECTTGATNTNSINITVQP